MIIPGPFFHPSLTSPSSQPLFCFQGSRHHRHFFLLENFSFCLSCLFQYTKPPPNPSLGLPWLMVSLTMYSKTTTLILLFQVHSPEFPALRAHSKRLHCAAAGLFCFCSIGPTQSLCFTQSCGKGARETTDLTRALCWGKWYHNPSDSV